MSLGATRADVAFVVLWAVAVVVMGAGSDWGDAGNRAVDAAMFVVLYAITRRVTEAPASPPAPPNVIPATVVIAVVVALTFSDALWPHGVGILGAWQALHRAIALQLHAAMPALNARSWDNTVRYVLLPAIPLVVLGWRACHVGFAASRRGTLVALALWSVPWLLFGATALAQGHGSTAALARQFAVNVFQNGYSEEILFRGAVLGVAVTVIGRGAGNVVQAIVFGLWHLGADMRATHGVVWLALCKTIADQALFGYAWGLVTLRTGSVLASGASHALFDAVAGVR